MGLGLHPAITILVALAPAAHVWWRNRRLLRLVDDPAFPERLLAERVASRSVFGVALGLLIATSVDRLGWAVPLLILARMAAAYPFRKRLFEETWGFFRYLTFWIRLLVAFFGWTFAAFLPGALGLAASHRRLDAIFFGAIAAVWTTWFSTVFRKILGTTPVVSSNIASRFENLRQQCGLPPIALEQIAMRGGVLANAVALPSLTGRAVVISDTLLDRFDEDEVVAILAHELAHHEHYDRRRLIKRQIGSYLVIVSGFVVPMVFEMFAPEWAMPGVLLWLAMVLMGIGLQMQHRQKHETESDLRGIALTGNPEAMIRALTKLNALARLPRRWSAEIERRATHPSLARRIQAIRDASNLAPAPIGSDTSFRDVHGTTVITFRDGRLEWSEGTTVHQFPYDALGELRIHATSSSQQLIAVDDKGRRWEFMLQPADVARAQSTLDNVDGRISKSLPPPPPARVSLLSLEPVRIIAWVGVTLAMSIGQLAALIPIVLAALRPASQLVAAAGTAAIVAAILGLRDDPYAAYGISLMWVDVILLLCGAVLVVLSVKRRGTDEPSAWKPLALIGVCSIPAWVIIVLSGTAAIELYRSVREWPSAAVLTLAWAGGLGISKAKGQRTGAAPIAAAGVLAVFMGTTAFAHLFVNDPFVARIDALNFKPVMQEPSMQEHPLDFEPTLAWISPRGGYVALGSEDDDENITIHAGRVGEDLRDYSADQAAFVGESRLLLLEREARGSVLRLLDLEASGRELWSLREPIRSNGLSVDRESGQWRLLGLDPAGNIAAVEGHVGDLAVRRTLWRSPAEKRYVRPIAASQNAVLAFESVPQFSPIESLFIRTSFIPPHFRLETRLWRITDGNSTQIAVSKADVECADSATMNDAAICSGFDGTSTRFFTVAADMGRLVPMAAVAGRFHARGGVEQGWLAGYMSGSPVLLRAGTSEALRVSGRSGERVYELAMGDTVVAALAWSGGDDWHSTLRIYSRFSISN